MSKKTKAASSTPRPLCKNPAHESPCYADCPACIDECQEFNGPKYVTVLQCVSRDEAARDSPHAMWVRDTVHAETLCESCRVSVLPGVLFPSDFDDRPDSKDGAVFIARCDECQVYGDDVDAARALEHATGWPMHKSMDETDGPEEDREAARGKGWFRPFFKCTLKDAERIMHLRPYD